MYTKVFRYHILEHHYPTWFHLSRASNALYADYPEVTFSQSPRKKVGGGMEIEEVVVYPSKQYCQQMHDELKEDPNVCEMTRVFLEIVHGELEQEEIGE